MLRPKAQENYSGARDITMQIMQQKNIILQKMTFFYVFF
jgi:hypothetical protein